MADKMFIWMQLLGFDRDDADCGAKRFLEQTGFVPDGVCALLFHADFVHQHRGMSEKYVLPPDVCAYYGIPQNAERKRQPWTNHDLRQLSRNLKAAGSGLYASIMGSTLNNAFHREWITDHPEIHRHGRGDEPRRGHFLLKRFRDGTYYEDFFIDKLCQTLVDYELKGVHLADGLCPPAGGMLHSIDFSTDFVTQFLDHSKTTLAPEITCSLGSDDPASITLRADWIWKHCREAWIRFNAWRWVRFFRKLCDRVHALEKEVIVLGMYCTDPFETLYCIGIDLAEIVKAGVDYISANILPTSCYMAGNIDRPYYFHRYMAIAPLTAAHLPKGHLISMLGVQDATEEWDVMHHAPCLLERDMYTMMAYQLIDRSGTSRALDGYFVCLGDGIKHQDWRWLHDRADIALSADVACCLSPAMLWSDEAYSAMLPAYIHTRRWTPFKLFYELAKAGLHCSAALRSEALDQYSGTLIVPDFDLLSGDEKQKVMSYDRGAVVALACPEFDFTRYGLQPSFQMTDPFSDWPMTAFVLGARVSPETQRKAVERCSIDDGRPNLSGAPEDAQEFTYTLIDTLPFAKVTGGFVQALADVILDVMAIPFTADKPFIALRLNNGAHRLFLFNDNADHYQRAFVSYKVPVRDVKIISKFPILPPRYIDQASGKLAHLYTGKQDPMSRFEVKLQPGGVTIVDVWPDG